MPYPLHKVPPGFLGVLNAKVSGQNPQIYSEAVAPTVETLDLYGLANRAMLQDSVGAQAGSRTAAQIVPSSEVWRVWGGSMSVNLNAGTTPTQPITLWMYVRAPNQAGWNLAFRYEPVPAVVPLTADWTLGLTAHANGLWLTAGWSIVALSAVTLTGVETYSVNSSWLVERFPA